MRGCGRTSYDNSTEKLLITALSKSMHYRRTKIGLEKVTVEFSKYHGAQYIESGSSGGDSADDEDWIAPSTSRIRRKIYSSSDENGNSDGEPIFDNLTKAVRMETRIEPQPETTASSSIVSAIPCFQGGSVTVDESIRNPSTSVVSADPLTDYPMTQKIPDQVTSTPIKSNTTPIVMNRSVNSESGYAESEQESTTDVPQTNWNHQKRKNSISNPEDVPPEKQKRVNEALANTKEPVNEESNITDYGISESTMSAQERDDVESTAEDKEGPIDNSCQDDEHVQSEGEDEQDEEYLDADGDKQQPESINLTKENPLMNLTEAQLKQLFSSGYLSEKAMGEILKKTGK